MNLAASLRWKRKDGVRNPSIDCLRGASILIVILLHYSMHVPTDYSPVPSNIVTLVTQNGFYGVTVFFVISGFLITSHALTRYGSFAAISLQEFYVARAVRIFPLLATCIAAFVLLHFVGFAAFRAPKNLNIFGAAWSALTFRSNWYYLTGGNVPGLASWGPLWSLSVEETFYALFPVICLALRSQTRIAAFLLLAIVQAPFVRIDWGHLYLLTGCADAIAMGCLAAMVTAYRLRLPSWFGLTLQVLGVGIIAWRYWYSPVTTDHIIGPSIIAFGTAIFLFGAGLPARGNYTGWTSAAFFPLRIIGRRSYEIYLLHMPLIVALQMWISPVTPHSIAVLVGFLIFIAAIGELVGRYFTDPIMKLARPVRVDRQHTPAVTADAAVTTA